MKKEKIRTGNHIWANNLWLIKLIWRYTPSYVFFMVIDGVTWGSYHCINIVYIQKLFDALNSYTHFEPIAIIIAHYGIYISVFWLFHQWYSKIYRPKIQEKLQNTLHRDMFRQAVQIDLARYDDPEFYNAFIWSMEQTSERTEGLMEDTATLINRVVASSTIIGTLFCIDLEMSVMILAISSIRIVLSFFSSRINLQYANDVNPLNRKNDYFKRIFRLEMYAKELRTTQVSDLLLDEFQDNSKKKRNVILQNAFRISALSFLQDAIGITGELGLVILMLYKVIVTKTVGLGSFAVAVNACWKTTELLKDLIERLMKYQEHGLFIEKMIAFMQLKPTIQSGNVDVPPLESLVINNLSFSYTCNSEESCVLRDVSLEIHRGEKIAIVGYNGAGKTTLTKLIMRLYDPSSGEILYNGHDIKEYKICSLRNRIAAVFQDYKVFACSVIENIVGGKANTHDLCKVELALKKSNLTKKAESLAGGLDTILTKEFDENGTLLSGGEQQKLALARAFYRNADLIIMDEPSSALDPFAEFELNKSILEYGKTNTIIFISHRLSTTRFADRIYMFDNGRIIEKGTHEELMAAGGKYANMFNLQAEKYRT